MFNQKQKWLLNLFTTKSKDIFLTERIVAYGLKIIYF